MYQVLYETESGELRSYCVNNMNLYTAKKMLSLFKKRYLDERGKGKQYPNGKGYYPFHSPRIVRVN